MPAPRHRLARIVLLAHSNAYPKIKPLSVAAAASRCGEYMRRVDAGLLRHLIALCSRIPGEEVVYGDSGSAAETIDTAVVSRATYG